MPVQSGHTAITSSAEFRLTSSDGLRVACARGDSRGPARGVVQIAHGMGEHIARYVGTIEVLVSAGLTVYGNDHRGHGRTAPSPTNFGDFGTGGFDLLVADMIRLSRIAREENPELPFILLGHSMGSFAAQQYVLDHSREFLNFGLKFRIADGPRVEKTLPGDWLWTTQKDGLDKRKENLLRRAKTVHPTGYLEKTKVPTSERPEC